jgi:type VI secretion system secreted protein VgrG
MLITTEARQAARGPIKDMGESTHRLAIAGDQHQLLAEIAQKNDAQEAGDNQGDVAALLHAQNEAIAGAAANGGSGFPELAKPHLVLASAAGIVTTSAGDTHIVSDRHAAITAGKSLSLAAGTNLFASIRQSFRLFVQKAGMKLVAAGGDIDVQALSDSIKLLAKLEISQTANRIMISAKEEIVINGGGSYAKFAAGTIELGTSGAFVAHAATHSLPSGKNITAPTISLMNPCDADHDQNESEQYFSFADVNGNPITYFNHRIDCFETKLHEGQLDEKGRTPVFSLDQEIAGTFWIEQD